MKKLDFKIIMLVAILLTIIIGFILVLKKLNSTDEEAFNNCIKNNSKTYCEKVVYGVY